MERMRKVKQQEAIKRLQSQKQAEIKNMIHQKGEGGHGLVDGIHGAMDKFLDKFCANKLGIKLPPNNLPQVPITSPVQTSPAGTKTPTQSLPANGVAAPGTVTNPSGTGQPGTASNSQPTIPAVTKNSLPAKPQVAVVNRYGKVPAAAKKALAQLFTQQTPAPKPVSKGAATVKGKA